MTLLEKPTTADLEPGLPGKPEANTTPSPDSLQQSLNRIRIDNPASLCLDHFPDFLILGPQRTGSTWLYHNLKTHPQIFLPREKETFFFSTLGRPERPRFRFKTLDEFLTMAMCDRPCHWVKKQYDCLRKNGRFYRPVMRGEATATNAILPVSVILDITRIRPGLKAILMLRDPIERAWSHACKDLVRGSRRRLRDIPTREFERFFRRAGQLALADYAGQICRWKSCLEPGHLFIGRFEMIASEPAKLLTRIHRFLGIDSGSAYFNRHLHQRINAADSRSARSRASIPPKIHEHLETLLEPELKRCQQLCAMLEVSASSDWDFCIDPEMIESKR